ncbi:Ankyrin repeat protein [Giardia duodenalis]|uniref:Ankyrin repeat protein n=1 Tax=Giardia intestinalis TaxID=5741 RepID=V6TH36_GIAIN|nr:Ankyrin repeat protein [Giardia intestinalis]
MTTSSHYPPQSDTFTTIIHTHEPENESWTHLASAAASGHVELVRKYMRDSPQIPIEGQIHFGWHAFPKPTPLILAAGHGHLDCVRLLMKDGAGSTTSMDQTALMAASAGCYPDIVSELMDKEAGRADKNGWTALMYAADRGCVPVCQMLVKLEANRTSLRSETALILAATTNKKQVVEILAPYEASESGLLAMELTSDEEIRRIIRKYLSDDAIQTLMDNEDQYVFE